MEKNQNIYLIQILLPLYDNAGNHFPAAQFEQVRDELTERFGGITTYLRSPAEGLWKGSPSEMVRDEIVIYEIMCQTLDREWWRGYRQELSRRYLQEVLIVRVSEMQLL